MMDLENRPQKEMFILVNLKMEIEMDLESISGMTEIVMKENGNKIKGKGMDNSSIKMEIFILVNLNKVKSKEKVKKLIILEI